MVVERNWGPFRLVTLAGRIPCHAMSLKSRCARRGMKRKPGSDSSMSPQSGSLTPPAAAASLAPQLVSLRTLVTDGGASFDWHAHSFEEFTLVTDDNCLIGYAPGLRETTPNTLLYYHAGEKHGSWSAPHQRPRFWVVHLTAGDGAHRVLSQLGEGEPTKRVWSLTRDQVESFQWIFLQLLNERSAERPHRALASSAWLQLLLLTIQRWGERGHTPTLAEPVQANHDVLRLWHLVNESVGKPYAEIKHLYDAPNYDSVRHAFRKTFGCSPREMLLRLRMEHAKNLLLETSLSMKEIAARIGYDQQHDFNRPHRRTTRIVPTAGRAKPLARSTRA